MLTGLTLPASVDTGTTGVDAVIGATATDDLSGVAASTPGGFSTCPDGGASSVGVVSPSGAAFTGTFRVVGGNGYAIVVRLPRYAEAGTWRVDGMFLTDCARNLRFHSTAQLAALGFPSTFQVLSPESDSTPPTLSALSIAPASVDVSAAAAQVTVSATITDDLSGGRRAVPRLRPDVFVADLPLADRFDRRRGRSAGVG